MQWKMCENMESVTCLQPISKPLYSESEIFCLRSEATTSSLNAKIDSLFLLRNIGDLSNNNNNYYYYLVQKWFSS